jgi:hypothetical protein
MYQEKMYKAVSPHIISIGGKTRYENRAGFIFRKNKGSPVGQNKKPTSANLP